MKKSSSLTVTSGTALQPSEQAVARPSTMTVQDYFDGLPISRETVVCLAAITASILVNTWNGDVVELSVYSATDMAKEAGVSEKEISRVMDHIRRFHKRKMKESPFSDMFPQSR
jgi:hypothetical protein